MKKLILLPFFGLLVSLNTVFAQSKIGYIEYEKVLYLMPEVDGVKAKLEETQKGYELNIEAMKKEMADIENLLQNTPNIDEMIKESKYRRYQSLQQEIQQFAYQAQEKIQAKEVELMKPLYDKLDAAIKEVALAKGYDFILTDGNAGGYVVVYSKNESDNITKAVMEKLGIKEVAATGTTGTKATESMMVKPKN
jgi:outer membrane protein